MVLANAVGTLVNLKTAFNKRFRRLSGGNMRSTFRKFIVGTVAASFVFATMPIAEVTAQKNGKGRDRGGERGGQQRQQRSNDQRGQRQEQRQQRSDDRGQQRQQEMQARQQERQQQIQQHQQRSNDQSGQQQMSDKRARQQQRNSDWSSRQQQDRSDRESRRQQQMSDRNSRQQQVQSDRESRRQQQMSDRNSRQQQRVSDARSQSGSLWQGFPRDNRRSRRYEINNGRNHRQYDTAQRENRRARWNRGYNGTPQWANRNYNRPAWNQYRREARRDNRQDYREDRRDYRAYNRYQRRSDSNRWNVNIFPSVNWQRNTRYDRGDYSWRSNQNNRYYSASNNYYPYSSFGSPVYVVTQPYYNSGYSGYDQNYGGNGQNYYPSRYSNSGYGDYYDDAYYGDDYGSNYYDDSYNDGGDWKSTLLRTVLSVVLGGSGDNFDDNSYAVDPAYAYSGNSPVYAPGGYYTSQPNWIYSPATYDATPYSDSPYRSMIYADPYTRDIGRQALSAGYSQGFIDGQNAANYGYDDYSSPYGTAPTAYSSYSTSMAERQRYMCEGYEIGYRDAQENRDSYGIDDGGGNLDIVSALLGSVMAS